MANTVAGLDTVKKGGGKCENGFARNTYLKYEEWQHKFSARLNTTIATRVEAESLKHDKYAVTRVNSVQKIKGGSNGLNAHGSQRKNTYLMNEECQYMYVSSTMKNYYYYTREQNMVRTACFSELKFL